MPVVAISSVFRRQYVWFECSRANCWGFAWVYISTFHELLSDQPVVCCVLLRSNDSQHFFLKWPSFILIMALCPKYFWWVVMLQCNIVALLNKWPNRCPCHFSSLMWTSRSLQVANNTCKPFLWTRYNPLPQICVTVHYRKLCHCKTFGNCYNFVEAVVWLMHFLCRN